MFSSIWGSRQQPSQKSVPKGYKAEAKIPDPISPLKLFVFPMAFFAITAFSFTLLWEIHKAVPIAVALLMLSTVFDFSSLGDAKNSQGEDVHGLLPSLSGPTLGRAIRVWLHIVLAWLAVFLGGVTGLHAEDTYMSQYYTVEFGRAYENVLATMPGAAYGDAGEITFAASSNVDTTKSVGFKEGLVYCAAPIADAAQGRKSISFWAIGYDCCEARGGFKCGSAGDKVRGGMRAPQDGMFATDHSMFLKAVNQSAAVNSLDVDEDVILLHWSEDPAGEATTKLFSAIGSNLIGCGLFALLVILLMLVGLGIEDHFYTKQSLRGQGDSP